MIAPGLERKAFSIGLAVMNLVCINCNNNALFIEDAVGRHSLQIENVNSTLRRLRLEHALADLNEPR